MSHCFYKFSSTDAFMIVSSVDITGCLCQVIFQIVWLLNSFVSLNHLYDSTSIKSFVVTKLKQKPINFLFTESIICKWYKYITIFLLCTVHVIPQIASYCTNFICLFLFLFSLLHLACCQVTQLLYQPLHIYKIYKINPLKH